MSKRVVVWDIEADSLTPTVIWCLCAYDVDEKKMYSFVRPDIDSKRFREFAKEVGTWIGHNVCNFDFPCVESLIGHDIIDKKDLVDTYVMSLLHDYNIQGGHSLEAWGERLRFPKVSFNDFSKFSKEMLEYCKQDVLVTCALYNHLKGVSFRALKCEQSVSFLLRRMHENGFPFNQEVALQTQEKIKLQLQTLDDEIAKSYPPRSVRTEERTVKTNKDGTVSKVGLRWYKGNIEKDFSIDAPFCLLEYETFNPASVKQMVEKLANAGWRPIEKTKTHIDLERFRPSTPEESKLKKERLKQFKKTGWKVNELNLSTVPDSAPAGAKLLVERMFYASRDRTLTEWLGAYNERTGSIHGWCQGIGTWTQRASHRSPNTANIAAEKSLKYSSPKMSELAKQYGKHMRSLWYASNGHMLVGTDAEGIQLRVLAHYLEDKGYMEAIVNGDKDKGTDIHSVNRRTLGDVCNSRDTAKTLGKIDVYKIIELRGNP